ncbi:MAG: dipeptide/oligopeptide/nickel ABC transporter ATP-binding protein [Desulfobacteraceae bacterium 4572_35.1]|nr:MAG: dipeptide/oligopeptide/nickel ABC transporter ATP-binding protein [Desulfobacteraceae bacterium 4572_35.1]
MNINNTCTSADNQICLDIKGLNSYFFTPNQLIKAVRDVDLTIPHGKTVAMVGESGCGKSMTALSILRLIPSPGRIVSGQIKFGGEDLLQLPTTEMRRIRGNRIAMIFQDPMTALNPVFTIGSQIAETLHQHKGYSKAQALERSVELLHQVGIPNPRQRYRDYPHQLSGGMRQRVMIAIALSCDPDLLIADEPTTALDVTIQAQIMALLTTEQQQRQMSTLLISHDLGVVAQNADIVAIMYDGLIVELATVNTIFTSPLHPYTQELLNCIPKIGQNRGEYLQVRPQQKSFWDSCPQNFAPQESQNAPLQNLGCGHYVRRWS